MFLQILEKHPSCQDVVRKIRQDKKNIEESSIIAQAKEELKSTVLFSPLIPQLISRQTVRTHGHKTRSSIPCTENTPSPCTPRISKRMTTCLNPEDLYNAKMERAQEEAKLINATEENEKLKGERDILQNQCDAAGRERSNLERKLHNKERELEEMATERKNLVECNNILKLKVSQAEKKKYMDQKTLRWWASEISKKFSCFTMNILFCQSHVVS